MTRGFRVHAGRSALWLLVFVGLLLHSSLCAPGVHAGTLRGTACASGSVVDILPLDVFDGGGATPPAAARKAADDRAGQPGRPCTPVPRPRHAPCVALTAQHLPTVAFACGPQAYVIGPASPPACGDVSAPPVRHFGADLLIALCASRT